MSRVNRVPQMEVTIKDDGKGKGQSVEAIAQLEMDTLFSGMKGCGEINGNVEGFICFYGYGFTEEEARRNLVEILRFVKPELVKNIAIVQP